MGDAGGGISRLARRPLALPCTPLFGGYVAFDEDSTSRLFITMSFLGYPHVNSCFYPDDPADPAP
jgi:hypothetical protein